MIRRTERILEGENNIRNFDYTCGKREREAKECSDYSKGATRLEQTIKSLRFMTGENISVSVESSCGAEREEKTKTIL